MTDRAIQDDIYFKPFVVRQLLIDAREVQSQSERWALNTEEVQPNCLFYVRAQGLCCRGVVLFPWQRKGLCLSG